MIPEPKSKDLKLTRQHAHEITLKSVSSEYEDVINKIKESARNGYNEIGLLNVHPSIKNELQDNGFGTMEQLTDKGLWVVIRW